MFGAAPLLSILRRTGVAIIPFVAVQNVCCDDLIKQAIGSDAIGHVDTGQQERNGTAEAIGQLVDLCGASTAGPTDRLAEFPPLPPAAQR